MGGACLRIYLRDTLTPRESVEAERMLDTALAAQQAHAAVMRDRAERVKKLAQETDRPKVVPLRIQR